MADEKQGHMGTWFAFLDSDRVLVTRWSVKWERWLYPNGLHVVQVWGKLVFFTLP